MRTRATRLLALLAVPGLWLSPSGTAWAAAAAVDRDPVPLDLQPVPDRIDLMNGAGDLVGTVGATLGEWPHGGPYTGFATGPGAAAYAMNDRGDVVGDDALAPGSAFLWRPGGITRLTVAGSLVRASAVSAHDQVVGDVSPVSGGALRAYSWRDGVLSPLSTPAGTLSYALDVNDHGQVLGMVVDRDWTSMHGAVWSGGRMTVIGRPDGPDTTVRAINDRGQVIGFSGGHPFLWTSGRMRDLLAGTGATTGFARAIDDRGVVIGEADSRAAMWTARGMRYLTPPGYYGEALWINARGDVAGAMRPSTGPEDQPGLWFRVRSGRITRYGAPEGTTAGVVGLDDHGRLIGHVDGTDGRVWVAWGTQD